jgi:hypothetical protein
LKIDAFLINDEIDLASLRIDFLREKVDLFYVGESNQTFSGKHKPLFFSEFLSKNTHLSSLVRVVILPSFDKCEGSFSRWDVEEHQRNFFLAEIRRLCQPDDIVFFCDVDEFPSFSQIEAAKSGVSSPRSLLMPCYYRKANWLVKGGNEKWSKAKVFQVKDSQDAIRYKSFELASGNPGVHLSYLGMNPEQIRLKYSNFSHAELDDPLISQSALLKFCDSFGLNHTGWSGEEGFGLLRINTLPYSDNFQFYLLGKFDHFFDTKPFKGNTLVRLIAANYVTKYLKTKNQKYLKAISLERITCQSWIFWESLAGVIKSLIKVVYQRIRRKIAQATRKKRQTVD